MKAPGKSKLNRSIAILVLVAVLVVVLEPGSGSGASVPAGGPKNLTPAQQRILTAPAVQAPDATFSFDRPPGPQFTAAQKQAQRDAGKRIVPMVLAAFRNGAGSVRIPPGDYRFGKERWDRAGVVYALEFSGLQRDAEQTFTIDASGATLWFDLPDDQAPTAHFAVGFKECRNLVFRGATLDRGTPGHVEGRIMDFDFASNRIEIQLSPGLTVPTNFSGQLEQRIVPFKADGTFCAPLYALQRGGTRLKYRGITPGSQPGRYWVTMQEPALLETIRNPAWQRAYGEQGVLRVGDGVSCVYAVSCALELVRCGNLTLDGLNVFMPKGWAAEWGGEGGHLWKNCYLGPRPGTSQWQGGEGFMFCATRHGTTLDNVTIRHTTDDTANFHGYWGNIQSIAGNRVTFELNPEFQRTVLRDVAVGDRLLFHDKTTGQTLGSALVTGSDGARMILDKPAESFRNSIVEWPDHACAGWTIQHCAWQDNYQRLLIQSGPGTVRNCTFTRQGSALELNSVMPYVEGGVPRDITITSNVFADVNPMPHGATITVYSHTFGPSVSQFSKIVIMGNTFIRPGETAVALDHVTGGVIAGNRFDRPVEYTALALPGEPRRRQAIWLSCCANFQVEGNALNDPGHFTAPSATTGTPIIGYDDRCRDISTASAVPPGSGTNAAFKPGVVRTGSGENSLARLTLTGSTSPWVAPVAEPQQFIVLNGVPSSAFGQVRREFTNSPGARVAVGAAAIFSYFAQPRAQTAADLQQFLRRSQETGLPVVIQLDGESWWGARPDLWNWWDPAAPGYSAANRANVEWTGWSPDDAIKIAWRNWGRQLRVLPPPNLMSPRYRAACHAEMAALIPLVLDWWKALPADQRHLFIGLKVGWESSIGVNAWYYPNGNSLLTQPERLDPSTGLRADQPPARGVVQIGYAAVKTAGLRREGAITEADLAEVARRHLEDLAREAQWLGVPRERLFTHTAGWKEGELLYQAAVNRFSCPGWSFYRHADAPEKDLGVQSALQHSDAPYWAAVEWLYQGPRQREPWRRALAATLGQPRCRYLCIYNWSGIRNRREILDAIRDIVAAHRQ